MQNLFSMLWVVFKRLWHNLGISLSALAGIVAVLAIVVCVPIFSYAVSGQVLDQQLNEKAATTHRRLFSVHMYYLASGTGVQFDLATARQLIDRVTQRVPELTGMRVERITLDIESGGLQLMPGTRRTDAPNEPLKSLRFYMSETLPANAAIVEGQWPEPDPEGSGTLKVAIAQSLADELFLNVGDVYLLSDFEIEVAGIWQIPNPEDPIWFSDPVATLHDKLWIPEATYTGRIAPLMTRPYFYTSWYVIINENDLRYQRAAQYARGLLRLDSELAAWLPGIVNDYSPVDALTAYQQRADSLATLLYAVSAPMIVLAFLFISLTSTIAVQQYEQETATLRGRGTSRNQVVSLNLLESLVLLLVSLPLAGAAGLGGAHLVSKSLSFLQFTDRPPLAFSFDGLDIRLVALVGLLVLAARFAPAWGISRTTIIRMKQMQARGSGRPLWERLYLDIVFLAITLYAFSVLRGWSKPAAIVANLQLEGQEQYRDPLLFVAPALFAIALCMFSLRILPLLIRVLAAIVSRLPGAWAYLSLQQVARRPQDHASALLLIMISLSLAILSASTAKTLDQWLYDSEYYRTGSDLAVQEFAVSGGGAPESQYGGGVTGPTSLAELDMFGEGYTAVDAHLKFPMVQAAARVGLYEGTFSFGTGETRCSIMGVDRVELPLVAFYRYDFASESLGALMNRLGADPYGVLIPDSVAEELGLQIGDRLNVAVTIDDISYLRDMGIVGMYEYFPTIYPSNKPTLIANLETIFDNPDSVSGYALWLKLKPDADVDYLYYQIRQMIGQERAVIKELGNTLETIKLGQDEPERLGVFGVLNVGFLVTGLMPGIGFVLYSYASLRRRFIQLGILQAIGLSVGQLIAHLVLEQFLLMGLAIIGGAGIGLLTSQMFVPFLQIGAAPGTPVPPFWVLIGWKEAGWLSLGFGVILFLTVLGTIAYLVRLKVFQAVKLGETL